MEDSSSLFEQLCEALSQKITKSGPMDNGAIKTYMSFTTIGAFNIAGGSAIVFSDGQVTGAGASLKIVNTDYSKIIIVSDNAVLLISGVPKVAKDMAKILKITFDNYFKLNDRHVTVRAMVNHVEGLLLHNRRVKS